MKFRGRIVVYIKILCECGTFVKSTCQSFADFSHSHVQSSDGFGQLMDAVNDHIRTGVFALQNIGNGITDFDHTCYLYIHIPQDADNALQQARSPYRSCENCPFYASLPPFASS